MTSAQPPYRIGVDVGGTFTDLVLVDGAGRLQAFKSPSVPADPAQGVLRAVELAAQALGQDTGALLRACQLFVHGSTIATNTLLEAKGAAVGLITTAGFRDALVIRRGLRPDPWDHRSPYPPVLVPRHRRIGVGGRLDARGRELSPLDRDAVADAARQLRDDGVEAVAICLLHSHRNPAHEQAAREVVRAVWPEAWVSCSSAVAPVIGDYERGSTVVVNAYVAPRVVPYLRALDRQLAALGLGCGLLLVQSNGGAVSVAEIESAPVQLILSGPAAGVGAIEFFRRDTGSDNLIAIEVGGTSCDVTLRSAAGVTMTDQLDVAGYHLAVPSVEIHTVGAGGGTIAKLDDGGLLQAGPEGAGARPGPACYGFGGTRPTVTDAQLLLGRLKPGPYAGGAIALDADKAAQAMDAAVAAPLGIARIDAAAGVIRLVEQNIQHAVERVSIERGYDPRAFTLVAAGGAGPLHGPAVARALGCAGAYIPRLAGVFCAFGMCNADVRHDALETWLRELDEPGMVEAMKGRFDALIAAGADTLAREGFAADRRAFERSLEMRYAGQQWAVPVATGDDLAPAALRRRFETVHERLYGYHQPDGRIEVVALRLAAIGRLPPVTLQVAAGDGTPPVPVETREVWLDAATGRRPVPVFDGTALRPGHRIAGPAVIDEATTTILIGPQDHVTVTPAGNYHVTW